ncbi:MAG: hypothetical protein HYU51_02410 [Candidatus Rokubacteria bacterium]|nr:hypothetical protein [Candidatus Rokubacteria bacterium]
MALEIILIVLAVVLFGGMFLGLFLSYREIEAERSKAPARADLEPQRFYGWSSRDAAAVEELMLRQIEHHLRREAVIAEQFIKDPSPQTLRAGEHSRLGAA